MYNPPEILQPEINGGQSELLFAWYVYGWYGLLVVLTERDQSGIEEKAGPLMMRRSHFHFIAHDLIEFAFNRWVAMTAVETLENDNSICIAPTSGLSAAPADVPPWPTGLLLIKPTLYYHHAWIEIGTEEILHPVKLWSWCAGERTKEQQ